MSKDYTGTRLDNVLLRVVIPWTESDPGGGVPEYHAGLLKSQARVLNDDGKEVSVVYDQTALGTAKSVPWTNKEIYDYIDNLCPALAVKLKALYVDGVNIDPST